MTVAPPSPAEAARAQAIAWIGQAPKRLLIGGQWVDAVSGKTFETLNPATEQLLCRVAEAEQADVDAAVAAARKAFEAPSWSAMSPHSRTRALLRIADKVEAHIPELAAIESLDNGMPLWYATAAATACADIFRYYAGWCSKVLGTTIPSDGSTLIYTLREPLGVCGQIIPWNVPVLMASIKFANALCCGNTVVLKPAELACLTSIRLAELIQETDLPPGVINVLPGFGPTAGAALAQHLGVDKIAFTGSTAVGKQVVRDATSNLKKVTLELGGKAPNVVFADADLDKAIATAVKTFCGNSGQVCSAGTRLFVQESIHDEVAERVASEAATWKAGDPFAADTKLGPLISARQRDRVWSYIGAGQESGAALRLGGKAWNGPGYFVEPTVFDNVKNGMKIAQEEIFGPVLSIIPFKDEDDAVLQGNETTYGLSAAVWTRDVSRAHKVVKALKAGRLWINTFGEADPAMAFGGYKQSGWGREFGAESIEAYTQAKSVMVRL
ncbi:aldehyde dehydrogenase family protein [Alicycliphilus denitrificans]|uniref:4-(hydroxymethyl)benzenesulfonate dehydrogenase n=1 Tax=Alicycliphilus denitrificans TaxID=179636 RepID=A0A858ZX44_9BURK|nr:aldehyde dehydrogenase family protein [Alicycliphilus denitrificans]ADV00640.1 Aldehyde Dehydrogenase [Alicycliphilus denitrificans BC]QKD44769.1 aldehyde dehydrogenase family protein [Alicycliphilus denitrificans]GAO24136.1 aldehyde dehydrogenase [Alicycliphilus sp. B1]